MDAGQIIGAQFGMCLQVGDQIGAEKMKEANKKLLLELLPLYGIKDARNFIGEEDSLNVAANENAPIPGQIGGVWDAAGAGGAYEQGGF